MEIRHALKNFLAQSLFETGVTQSEAAKMLGFAPARASVLCNGKPGKFSLEALLSYAEILGFSSQDLVVNGRLTKAALEKANQWSPPERIKKIQPSRERFLEVFNDAGNSVAWKTGGRGRAPGRVVKCRDGRGYLSVTLDGVMLSVHRVLWTMRNGEIPKGFWVDHIDGNQLNNSVSNLRLCRPAGNNQNRRMNSNNSSGAKCVVWNKTVSRWQVQMCVGGKVEHIGCYEKFEEAESAARSAREKLHLEFSNHG